MTWHGQVWASRCGLAGHYFLEGKPMIYRIFTNIYFILAGAVILAALAVWFAPQGGADLGRWI